MCSPPSPAIAMGGAFGLGYCVQGVACGGGVGVRRTEQEARECALGRKSKPSAQPSSWSGAPKTGV